VFSTEAAVIDAEQPCRLIDGATSTRMASYWVSSGEKKPVRPVLDQRGEEPGVVWIWSAMEPSGSYQPWHDQRTHKTYRKPNDGKCLHYYI
jgi:hypothetical protein